MELLIVSGLGIAGSWVVVRLLSIGEKRPARQSGYYVSPDYRRKMARASRSEFTANRMLGESK